MLDSQSEPNSHDPGPHPVPLGRLDEPTALCVMGEWVPEPLLGIVRQRVLDELAKLSPELSITRLTKLARISRQQMRRFLAGEPTQVEVVQSVLEPLGYTFGFTFIDDTFIMVPKRLIAEIEKTPCPENEQPQ